MFFFLALLAFDEAARIEASPRLPLERTEIRLAAPLGFPSAVALGPDHLLYILQRAPSLDPILVTDRAGKILRSWGRGLFKIPHSIRFDPQGNLWTTDSSSSMIYKFSRQGEKLLEIAVGGQPSNGSDFNGTTDIAFAPNGHLYISDGYGNARILEYSAAGERLREFGRPGAGPTQFNQPHGLTIDPNGVIYVADRKNGRIQRFNLDGRLLGEFPNLGMVTSVTYAEGALWVGTQRLQDPTSANGWLLKLHPRTGEILGHTASAHGHHCLNVRDGIITSGARPDHVWLWRPAKP